MKYIKLFETMEPQAEIKEVSDKLLAILNYKTDLFGTPVCQFYDHNISSTFFITGRIPKDNKEVRVNLINIQIDKKGISFALKKIRKGKKLGYIKHLLELHADKNLDRIDGFMKDFYDLPVKNYKDFINELTIENFEMWQEVNKYNL